MMSMEILKRPRVEEIMELTIPAFVRQLNAARKSIQDFKIQLVSSLTIAYPSFISMI